MIAALSPTLGPLVAATALLAAAGVGKLRRPAPTGLALARVGLPGSDPVVRILGLVEVVAALDAVAFGRWTALPVAALYGGFAAFTGLQVRRAATTGAVADCGCFGDDSAPVDGTHVVVNLALAVAAGAVVAVGADGVVAAWADDALGTVIVVALGLLAARGLRALLTDAATVRSLLGPRATD